MRGSFALCLLACGICASAPAAEPALAFVAALQPPVWVERDGARRALAAGDVLQAGDRYETGTGGRLQIGLREASTIKLGEEADFAVPVLAQADDGSDTGVLRGALKVLRGAFRFTTSAIGALRRRELDVAIGPTVTVGIRGTDVWGKSDAQRDLVCLIEGRIDVSSPGEPVRRMDRPLSYYYVPRGKPAPPIAPAPPAELAQWVPQTDLRDDLPALYADGRYRVSLVSYAQESRAHDKAQRLSEQGYAATVQAYPHGGRMRYRLVVAGLRTQAEAQRFADAMKVRLQLPYPWVMAPP
ncbi:SPOR domain-containing protein [Fontimonas sp. SYSU GA230001]|uniref:SPOR domain-containing protein n=1 Tax=Fontimonas sp. SYSU GA230001 TaxID=3142450 RepID=UPI0032B4CF43